MDEKDAEDAVILRTHKEILNVNNVLGTCRVIKIETSGFDMFKSIYVLKKTNLGKISEERSMLGY